MEERNDRRGCCNENRNVTFFLWIRKKFPNIQTFFTIYNIKNNVKKKKIRSLPKKKNIQKKNKIKKAHVYTLEIPLKIPRLLPRGSLVVVRPYNVVRPFASGRVKRRRRGALVGHCCFEYIFFSQGFLTFFARPRGFGQLFSLILQV